MGIHRGASHYPAPDDVRRRWKIAIPLNGDILRPGKTRRDHESGAWANRLANRAARGDKR